MSVLSLTVLLITIFPTNVFADYETDYHAVFGDYANYEDGAEELCGSVATSMSGDDVIATVFNFFVGKGYTDFQAAGILGNMQHESGYQPLRFESTPSGVETLANDAATKARENQQLAQQTGSYYPAGWGLVQWTPATKIIDPLQAEGKDPNDIMVQLEFLWGQLEGETTSPEKAAGDHLKATTNVAEATVSFETKYERHAGPPQPSRIVEAERVLELARNNGIQETNVSGDVYILGDSITVGANDHYMPKFAEKSITPTISAVNGRSWTTPGNPALGAIGTQGTAKSAAAADKETITTATSIVVALGTNGTLTGNPPDEIIETLRSYNTNSPIWWVNVANGVKDGSVQAFNNALSGLEEAGTIKVIDWADIVDPGGDGTNNPNGILSDGTHPTTEGYAQYTDLVVGRVAGGTVAQSAAGNCNGTTGNGGGSGFVETVKAYAWPEYKGRFFAEQKPEYAAAIAAASADGQYIGGANGNDCGAFVTRVMIDSGYEPEYNYAGRGGPTGTQIDWVRENWTEIGTVESSAELLPGDVAFHLWSDGSDAGHTFLWLGEDQGFQYGAVEAALGKRSPMATITSIGPTTYDGSNVVWFRK